MTLHLRTALLPLVLAAAACGGDVTGPAPSNFDGPPAPDPHDPYVVPPSAYCMIVARPGTVRIDRDLVTTCPPATASDGEAAPPCVVERMSGGMLVPVAVDDARVALRADGDKMVVLHTTGELSLVDGSHVTQLAAWAADPSVAPDLVRIAYVTTLEGATPPTDLVGDPGTPTRILVHDMRDDSELIITEDPDASMPRGVPSSNHVLYISTRTGLASVWRGNGEYEIQVTNVDLLAGDQGVVPAYGARAVWVPDTRRLVYEAAAEDSRLWELDVAAGTAVEVGPGAWPVIGTDGDVVGATALASDPSCATMYPSMPMP